MLLKYNVSNLVKFYREMTLLVNEKVLKFGRFHFCTPDIQGKNLQFSCEVKLETLNEGFPTVSFSKATTTRCRGRCNSIPWIAPLYL